MKLDVRFEAYLCISPSSARFGPNGIRQGGRRLGIDRINVPAKIRITDHLDVVDCGDVREWCFPSCTCVRSQCSHSHGFR